MIVTLDTNGAFKALEDLVLVQVRLTVISLGGTGDLLTHLITFDPDGTSTIPSNETQLIHTTDDQVKLSYAVFSDLNIPVLNRQTLYCLSSGGSAVTQLFLEKLQIQLT